MFGLGTTRDDAIVGQVLSGNHDAFELLVSRYLPVVRAIAMARLGKNDDVDDVAQDSFLSAYQQLDQLRERRKFGGWLCAIARRACVRRLERRDRERALAEISSTSAQSPPDFGHRELMAAVRNEADQLDVDSREVVLLYYFSGKSSREIAALLDISDGAVRKRLQRAREALGERLLQQFHEEELGTSGDGAVQKRITGAVLAAGAGWASSGSAVAATGMVGLPSIGWAAAAGNTIMGKIVALFIGFTAIVGTIVLITQDDENVAMDRRPLEQEATAIEAVAIESPSVVPALAKDPAPPVTTAALATPQGIPVAGRILESDGTPIPVARIVGVCAGMRPVQEEHETQSNEEGAFTFYVSQPWKHVYLNVTKEGFPRNLNVAFDVPEEGLKNANFVLYHGATMAGTVVDIKGRAVADMPVTAFNHDAGETLWTHETLTDSTGAFQLDGLIPGTHGLAVIGERDFDPDMEVLEVSVNEGDALTGVKVVYPGEGQVVAGRVVDDLGAPIEGVGLEVMAPGNSRHARTDAQGDFRLTHLSEGTFNLYFHHEAHEQTHVVVMTGADAETYVLRRRGRVSGQVVDQHTGQPISAFRIISIDWDVAALDQVMEARMTWMNNENGLFDLENVQPEEATIVAKAAGYRPTFLPVTLTAAEHLDNVKIALQTGLTVQGTVYDSHGAPVSDAFVLTGIVPPSFNIDPEALAYVVENAAARTDENGHFTVSGLSPGPVRLSAVKRDQGAGTTETEVLEGTTNTVDISLSLGGTVRGVIRVGGESREGILVFVAAHGGKGNVSDIVESDAQGGFEFSDIPAGLFSVVALMPHPDNPKQQRRLLHDATVSPGQVTEVALDFKANFGTLIGHVTLNGEAECAGFAHSAVNVGPCNEERQMALQHGEFRFENIVAGLTDLRVTVVSGDFETLNKQLTKLITVDVVAGETREIDVDFTGTGSLRGQVLGVTDQHYGAIQVLVGYVDVTDMSLASRALHDTLKVGYAQVNSEGFYSLEGLDAGTYTLLARSTPKGSGSTGEKTRFATTTIQLDTGEAIETNFDLR